MGSSRRRCRGRKLSCCFIFLNIFKSWRSSYDTTDDDVVTAAADYEGIFDWEVEPGINRRASDFIKKFHDTRV
ncbi:hypothetical protein CRYUN_Cryun10bG0000800 [Craigia yunnanensis]